MGLAPQANVTNLSWRAVQPTFFSSILHLSWPDTKYCWHGSKPIKTGLAGSITYLMTPEPLQIIGPFNDIRRGQQSALYDTSEVSQVEQIVGFRGCGQQICHGILVHFQSAVYQHFTDSKIFLCKAPGIERKCIIQLFTCSFQNIWLAKDVL